MDLQQCYTTLDLPFGASFEEVKRAYKELVRVWHPDRFPNSPDLQQRAHSKLSRINEAYETLKAHFESGGPQPQAAHPKKDAHGTNADFPYRDDQCRYLGDDPRLRSVGQTEIGGRPAVVEVAPDGVILLTLSGTQPDEVIRYPNHTIRWLRENDREWIAPSLATMRFRRELEWIGDSTIRLAVTDPEGIVQRGIEVELKFRNSYYTQLFTKRIRAAFGLFAPQPKPKRPPPPKPEPSTTGATKDPLWAFVGVVVLVFGFLGVARIDRITPAKDRITAKPASGSRAAAA